MALCLLEVPTMGTPFDDSVEDAVLSLDDSGSSRIPCIKPSYDCWSASFAFVTKMYTHLRCLRRSKTHSSSSKRHFPEFPPIRIMEATHVDLRREKKSKQSWRLIPVAAGIFDWLEEAIISDPSFLSVFLVGKQPPKHHVSSRALARGPWFVLRTVSHSYWVSPSTGKVWYHAVYILKIKCPHCP